MSLFRFILTALFLMTSIAQVALSQQGVSSMGHARSRYLASLGRLPEPGDIIVEDIINYHRHQLPAPPAGQAVSLDVRWDNPAISTGQHAILQIGLSTAQIRDRSHLRPLNLGLVIDSSGSMAASDKMRRVKQALHRFVTQLRRSDIVSLVAYDSEATLLIPSTRVGDGSELRDAIDRLRPGGSTNLHEGLMFGYREVARGYRKGATNRVILLTDGIANTGVTEPDAILRDSSHFNSEGIDLSTIGVGLDLNRELLGALAEGGRGLFHFVADNRDIAKVFVTEFQSLVAPVARKVTIQITHDPSLTLENLYGYRARQYGNRLEIDLDDLNHGVTQVILLDYKLGSVRQREGPLGVEVHLSYDDVEGGRRVERRNRRTMNVVRHRAPRLEDHEVRKNYTIAVMAEAMHDMAVACQRKRFRRARRSLDHALSFVDESYPEAEDRDIARTRAMMVDYRRTLDGWVERDT